MKVISFKIPNDLLEYLEMKAKQRGVSKSELIRRAIQNCLERDEPKPFISKRIRIYP